MLAFILTIAFGTIIDQTAIWPFITRFCLAIDGALGIVSVYWKISCFLFCYMREKGMPKGASLLIAMAIA